MFSNFKIRSKLFVLAGILIILTAGIGGYSLVSLNKSYNRLSMALDSAELSGRSVDTARIAQVHFKIQVQEWKNILLRGHAVEDYNKYYNNFLKEEKKVQEELITLKGLVKKQGVNTNPTIDRLIKIHTGLGEKYKEALKHFNASNPENHIVIDKLVRGIDRAPTDAMDNIVKQIQEANDLTIAKVQEQALDEYNSSLTVFIVILLVSTGLAAFLSAKLTQQIIRPINMLNHELDTLAEKGGDLTQKINVYSKDEVGNLASAVNKFLSNLRKIIIEINNGSNRVAETAQLLTSNSRQASAGANETAAAMNDISATVERATSNVLEISKTSQTTTDYANKGNKGIAKITYQMQSIANTTLKVTNAINELNRKSLEINQITELISTIADQTNLLALNAAIEAARVGEHGKGFAVVAEEVRKLAEGSAKSAREITTLVSTIQAESQKAVDSISEGGKEVEEGTKVVQEVGENFKEIISSVQGLTAQIGEVAAAITQVSSEIQNVAAGTEEQNAAIEEVSASAESLSELANRLNTLVGNFKVV